jgi:hypothetical protein
MEERWEKIKDYPNYSVSDLGRVRNDTTGRILKAYIRGGYVFVGLSNLKTKTYPVHRLVASTFIPNSENKSQVNHKNKNRSDNNVNNLEWVTPLENNIHRSTDVIQTTNQNLKISKIEYNTNIVIEKYNSIKDASLSLMQEGVSDNIESIRSCISNTIRNVTKTAFGYKWQLDIQEKLENEEWRDIHLEGKGTNGYYISSLGRFKNSKGVIMENYKPHHSGYIYVRVNCNKYALHRLVALTFIENINNKPFVNHIDGNKLNNNINNLEWVTCSENNLHNYKIGLNKGHKREIIQFDLQMNEIKKFSTIKEASTELSISLSCIKDVLKEKQKSSKGFIFKYVNI